MIAYLILLLGGLTLVLGALLCLRGKWVLAWVRGTLGLALVGGAILLIAYGLDLRYYQVLISEQPVARLLIEQTGDQQWQVLVQSGERSQRVDLSGDEWRLDARVLRWPASWQAMGVKPRYRLDRISGRYRNISQELNAPRTAVALSPQLMDGNWWSRLDPLALGERWLDAAYGSSAYHPLQDGAIYEVSLTNSGLISRPVNDEARAVLADWLRTTDNP